MKSIKKTYSRPQLVEYGKLAEVTKGLFGRRLDNAFFNNDDCSGILVQCGTASS